MNPSSIPISWSEKYWVACLWLWNIVPGCMGLFVSETYSWYHIRIFKQFSRVHNLWFITQLFLKFKFHTIYRVCTSQSFFSPSFFYIIKLASWSHLPGDNRSTHNYLLRTVHQVNMAIEPEASSLSKTTNQFSCHPWGLMLMPFPFHNSLSIWINRWLISFQFKFVLGLK